MTKKIFAFTIFILFGITVFAQKNNNIHWTYSSINQNDGSVKLLFEAVVDDGFRVYSPYNPEGASKPLEINILKSENYKTNGTIVELQKPTEHYEEIFGVTEKFFTKSAKFSVLITPIVNNSFDVRGNISGQICNDEFMCSAFDEEFSITVKPQLTQKKNDEKKSLIQENNVGNVDSNSNTNADTIIEKLESVCQTPKDVKNDSSSIETALPPSESLLYVFLLAALGGLAAIFTPCVFPMLPMTVSFFLKKNKNEGKYQALVYGIFIILIYTVPVAMLILISSLLGGQTFIAGIFNALSTHWFPNLLFFLVFMVFALSFLGMFEITMPSSLVNKFDKRGSAGGIVGIFFMAFVLVLVSFSCTGPIVGTVLVQSASGGSATRPIVAMLGFSLAFALPFTFFAFFPNLLKKLPGYGGWLNTLKVVLGFVELALGLKFLSVADQTYHWHILDREVYLAIWIAISVVLGLYLLGKIKLPNDEEIDVVKVPRLILSIIVFSFAIYLIPGMFGAPLKALSGYLPPLTTQDFVISEKINYEHSVKQALCETPLYSDFLKLPHSLTGYFDLNQGMECAKKQNKPLLLVFTGHGCVNCRKMEENVWSNAEVLELMRNNFVITALYTDDRYVPDGSEISIGKKNTNFQIEKYNMNAQPYYVVLNPQDIDNPLVKPISYTSDAEIFKTYLNNALNKFSK